MSSRLLIICSLVSEAANTHVRFHHPHPSSIVLCCFNTRRATKLSASTQIAPTPICAEVVDIYGLSELKYWTASSVDD